MKTVNNLLVVLTTAIALMLMPVAIVVVAFCLAKSWLDNALMEVVLK